MSELERILAGESDSDEADELAAIFAEADGVGEADSTDAQVESAQPAPSIPSPDRAGKRKRDSAVRSDASSSDGVTIVLPSSARQARASGRPLKKPCVPRPAAQGLTQLQIGSDGRIVRVSVAVPHWPARPPPPRWVSGRGPRSARPWSRPPRHHTFPPGPPSRGAFGQLPMRTSLPWRQPRPRPHGRIPAIPRFLPRGGLPFRPRGGLFMPGDPRARGWPQGPRSGPRGRPRGFVGGLRGLVGGPRGFVGGPRGPRGQEHAWRAQPRWRQHASNHRGSPRAPRAHGGTARAAHPGSQGEPKLLVVSLSSALSGSPGRPGGGAGTPPARKRSARKSSALRLSGVPLAGELADLRAHVEAAGAVQEMKVGHPTRSEVVVFFKTVKAAVTAKRQLHKSKFAGAVILAAFHLV